MHVRVPAGEVGRAFLAGAFGGPGFHLPVVALDDADEVEQLAAAQEVVHDVPPRPDPVGPDRPHPLRQAIRRNDAAPRHEAEELRPVGAEQRVADGGVHAVGADQGVAVRRAAVSKAQRHAAGILLNPHDLMAEMDRVALVRHTASASTPCRSARWKMGYGKP